MAKVPIVKRDSDGIAELATSPEMHRAIKVITDGIAARVRGMEQAYPVETKMITTDRAHGLVTIASYAGMAVQAKRGSLTKAAAQAGLDVTLSPGRLTYTTKSGKKRLATQKQIDSWTRGRG